MRLHHLPALALGLMTPQQLSAAFDPPAPCGQPVCDGAQVLKPEEEAYLSARIHEMTVKTGHQLFVVTVPSLQGYGVEEASIITARKIGGGSASGDDGVLLLHAPKERKYRIEVGTGLEAMLTDWESERINTEVILPLFKQKKMGEGLMAGADAIIREISEPGEEQALVAQRAITEAGGKGGDHGWLWWILGGLAGIGGVTALGIRRSRRQEEDRQRLWKLHDEMMQEHRRQAATQRASESTKKRAYRDEPAPDPDFITRTPTPSPTPKARSTPRPSPPPSSSYDYTPTPSYSPSPSYSSPTPSYDPPSPPPSPSPSYDGGGGSYSGGGDSGSY